MITEIRQQLTEHRRVMEIIENELTVNIAAAVDTICTALAAGRKLMVMGNGGSAADAQHFAAEIVGRFKMERPALPAIALTTDSSILTAIGNDYGYDAVFSRQIEAFAVSGDVVVGISTSGNSPNVLAALQLANERGCRTVALLGRDGGAIGKIAGLPLIVPVSDTPRVQEGHITIIHIICDLLEKKLFAG